MSRPAVVPIVESLEARRVLSGGPFVVPVVPGIVTPPADVGVPAAPKPKPSTGKPGGGGAAVDAGPRSTNLVGRFEGEVTAKLFIIKKKLDAVLVVQSQTATSITGRLEVEGETFAGTFNGKINPKNGRFRYALEDDGDRVEITGQLGRRGNVIGGGKISADYGGFKVKGGFQFDRVA